MEASAANGLGFAHFLTQADAVGKGVLVVLLLISIASWYLIVTKAVANALARRRARDFEARLRAARAIGDLPRDGSIFALLAAEALAVARKAADKSAAERDELVTRTLNHLIDREMARAEHGLTVLATAGSAAPYIGLFGTVWGIYHALVQIGFSGQGTLDKVAGPVGEALVMTALGLAVAIPAVLAYNAFQRRNRLWLMHLESFAHDIFLRVSLDHGKS